MFEWLSWSNPVSIWWVFLSFFSVLNILFWFWTRLYKYQNIWIRSILKFNQPSLIWFSFFYVFVCAFRSFFPRADVQKIVIWDTWFSSIFVGRTLATIAELVFVAQWYIVIYYIAELTKDEFVKRTSKYFLLLIAIAECFSWYAVITTNYIGNSIEESLWGIAYILIGFSIYRLRVHFISSMKLAMNYAIVGCVLYVAFMFKIDVPMYIGRFIKDSQNGKQYLGIIDGLIDLNTSWHVTRDINDWATEIPWQSLYFTFAVLVSISLCYIPLSKNSLDKYLVKK